MTNSNKTITAQDIESHPYFKMVRVEGGTFWMGDDDSAYEDEKPAHEVRVPDFYLGKYPITQAIWELVMGENPSWFKGASLPVEQVSWDQIVNEFLPKLNQLTGKEYRLPSEAEWEYAARGGKHKHAFTYSGSNHLKEVGWFTENSFRETKRVGLKLSNALGLHDMSGNVDEWCADHWHENYKGAPDDGAAWVKGGDSDRRVVRGGSWFYDDYDCRVSGRYRVSSYNWFSSVGFRVARY